ncbi:MAG: right-handed parallel beta-helix repeat-containing protein [Candidatus Neomarinimicrobiota bacterium]
MSPPHEIIKEGNQSVLAVCRRLRLRLPDFRSLIGLNLIGRFFQFIIPKFLVLFIGLSALVWPQEGIVYYLSPGGNDAWSGTLPSATEDSTDGPFATLKHVRGVIRGLQRSGRMPEGGVTVYLRGGVYYLSESFQLTIEDSGTPACPIIYRSYGNEEVRLSGGVELEPTTFEPVQQADLLLRLPEVARDQVVQVDLRSQGVTDFGVLESRGMGRPIVPAALELFFDDKAMPMARWPNEGWAQIKSVPKDSGGGKFTYQGRRPEKWSNPGAVWLHGYWTKEWADSYEQVANIDYQTRQIATHEPHGVYGYAPKGRYYAFNIPEELDRPGEWYLDTQSGLLLFWPPEPLVNNRLSVSILEDPLILMEDVSHVTFRNLIIEVSRGPGLLMRDGGHNLIAGCTFRNLGNQAVSITGGEDNGVVGCDIYSTGDGGIVLSGGDYHSLTPSGHFACNNHIYDYSRWVRTYRPAVSISGVGQRVEHNLIHKGSHAAIILGGNDHIIEYNEVHHVCEETGDAGAFYMGRNWTYRGNVIRYNYFHDIKATQTQSVKTVYLDDFTSGTTVSGNIFKDVSFAVFIGGGRDNVVENNLFVNASPAIYVDERGTGWAKEHVAAGGILRQKLEEIDYRTPPWSNRYPELVSILDDRPELPKGNLIRRNVAVGGQWLHLTTNPGYMTFQDNDTALAPGYLQREGSAVNLKDGAPAYDRGFRPIPVHDIGLYLNGYRKFLPRPGKVPSSDLHDHK